MPQRVFVDANILYSKTLMDWLFLLRIHNEGMFQLHSTEDVFAEVLYWMRKNHPRAAGSKTRHRLELIRDNLDEVLGNFPPDLDFSGDDDCDYHVHAAAVELRADFILTADDPKDFTADPDAEPYEVINPDAFFLLVADSAPECVVPIVREQFDYWKSKDGRWQLDDALRKAGCSRFADRVRSALGTLAMLR